MTHFYERLSVRWSLVFMQLILLMGLLVFMAFPIQGAELIRISPISNTMVLVYIEDGFIDTYGEGQGVPQNKTYHDPAALNQLLNPANYMVSSVDDPDFSSPQTAINIGRKSKAIHYNDQWSKVPYVFGHWVYIELPFPLKEGKNYDFKIQKIVEGREEWPLNFNSKHLRSETVHVNMVGFAPASPKYGYLSQWMGDFNTADHPNGGLTLDQYDGQPFRIVKYATGEVVYSGTVALRRRKDFRESGNTDFAPTYNYSNADVFECDFSDFSAEGEYVLSVDNLGCSYPFEIGGDATKEPFYFAMKGLFWSRQGVDKEMNDGSIIPRDHHYEDNLWLWDNDYLPGGDHSNKGFNVGNAVAVNGIYGYYHDAGDWDGYIHHAKVPISLLMLYDLAPDKFHDGDIDNRYRLSADSPWIDEGSNGIPDLLDEAVWLINYYKRARTILKEEYGASGGVPGYVGQNAVPGDNTTAWNDHRDWYLSGESAWQTYYYAGLAAYYAICLDKWHQLTASGSHAESVSWLKEAEEAYAWAEANPQDTDLSSVNNNEYRVKGFAAAALFRLTGEVKYQDDFKTYLDWEPQKANGEWSNQNIIDVCYALFSLIDDSHPNLDLNTRDLCKEQVISKADNYKVWNNQKNAFRIATEFGQFLQLGGMNTPRLTLVPFAHKLTGDQKYLDVVHNSLNYVLGGNQLNMTYLSGLGEQSDQWIFNPNGWLGNDRNSMVYPSLPYIGLTSYFTTTDYWYTIGITSEYWTRGGTYPNLIDNPQSWPGAEQTFMNQFSVQGGEFTVHQQNNSMIYGFGYQKAMDPTTNGVYRIASAPTVSLNLTEGQQVGLSSVDLTVDASSTIRAVRYFYDWHFIGESEDKANNFALNWNPPVPDGTSVLVTAVAIDHKGQWSVPTSEGEKYVTVKAGPGDDITPPAVPSNLYINNIETFSFQLHWSPASDASGVKNYEVYIDNVLRQKTPDAYLEIDGLDPNTTYSLQVLARDKEGNVSAKSAAFNGTTADIDLGNGQVHQQDANGVINVQAETYSYRDDGLGKFVNKFWYEFSDPEASGGTYMMVQDNNNSNSAGSLNGPRMDYTINFTQTGTHYVWVRANAPTGSDNSIILAHEGNNLGDWSLREAQDWQWYKASLTFESSSATQQTFSIYMREDGTQVDRLVIATDPDLDPSALPEQVPMSVSLVSPFEGQTYQEGEATKIEATVTGTVDIVNVFRVTDGKWIWLANLKESPYIFEQEFPVGTHEIRVRAIAPDGEATDYELANIVVSPTEIVHQQGADGVVIFEAEKYSDAQKGEGLANGMQWQIFADVSASEEQFIQVPDNGNIMVSNSTTGPGVHYDIDFVKSGVHYLWLRHRSPNGTDNSVNVALNGKLIHSWHMPDQQTEWKWAKMPVTFNVAVGKQRISLFLREDGTPVDRVVVTNDQDYVPENDLANQRVLVNDAPLVIIYPNPSNGTVYIDSNGQLIDQLLVLDAMGRIIMQRSLLKQAQQISLPSGTYLMQISMDGITHTKKVLIH